MNYFKLILVALVMFCANAAAQTLGIKSSSVTKVDGKVLVSLELSSSDVRNRGWNNVVFKPVLTDGQNVQELKTMTLKRNSKQDASYKAKTTYQDWMANAKLKVTREVMNANKQVLNSQETLIKTSFADETVAAASNTKSTVSTASTMAGLIGSYMEPEEDVADKQNKVELYLSLDEMRICENITPELLTLRQLYEVAQSYRDENPEKFYEVITKSVKLFQASPIANLNAASISIERGDLTAAGEYLKNARMGTVEYKNVRGIYELMTGNFNEGIRLLKSAKSSGCAEASSNLDYFFANYQVFAAGN